VTGARVGPAIAAVLAAVVMTAALGACGSDGSTKAQDAAQDRQVEGASKVEQQNLAKMKSALRTLWLARARARRAAAARHRRAARRTVVVGSVQAGGGDVCAPIGPRFGGRAGRAERRWRRLQRQRVLDYLNLSCPSLNVPRV
jgi:hypothetical protein